MRPEKINQFIRSYTHKKTPHFFKYAKGKTDDKVEPLNDSTVNKLEKLIKNKKLSFKHMMDFNYENLMHDPDIKIYDGVVELFVKLKQKYHRDIRNKSRDDDDTNITYIGTKIRHKMSETGFDDVEITDMLVSHSYGVADDKYKKLLWLVYGDIILENIKCNLSEADTYCLRCGKRFKKRSNHHKFCDECANKHIYKVRKLICVDCGKEFEVPLSVRRKTRCDECQRVKKREYEREKKRRQRSSVPTFKKI